MLFGLLDLLGLDTLWSVVHSVFSAISCGSSSDYLLELFHTYLHHLNAHSLEVSSLGDFLTQQVLRVGTETVFTTQTEQFYTCTRQEAQLLSQEHGQNPCCSKPDRTSLFQLFQNVMRIYALQVGVSLLYFLTHYLHGETVTAISVPFVCVIALRQRQNKSIFIQAYLHILTKRKKMEAKQSVLEFSRNTKS